MLPADESGRCGLCESSWYAAGDHAAGDEFNGRRDTAGLRQHQGDQDEDLHGAGVLSDLHEISRGIHPAILSEEGLGPALKTLGRPSSVPATIDIDIDRRLPESIEVGTYFVVAEALTNAAKHARASKVIVRAETRGVMLCVLIRDDGAGGADPGKGSGLIGLIDRVETLGGHMQIDGPPAAGTTLHITIPLQQGDG